jgi:peroxiredoxin (alkyl hydroperoxide reductase subunit C)
MGAEVVARGQGFAYRFGEQQLNLHGPGRCGAGGARSGTAGQQRSVLRLAGPIADAAAHLRDCGVDVELGRSSGQGRRRRMSVYFRDPDGSLLEFISYREAPLMLDRSEENRMAINHDPTVCRTTAGAAGRRRARHLTGARLPDFALAATDGSTVNLSRLPGRTVVYIYPRTGGPGRRRRPAGTPFRGARLHAAILRLSRSLRRSEAPRREAALRLSTQTTDYQREAAERLHLPFAILSDEQLAFTARAQPADLLGRRHDADPRMAWVIDDGVDHASVLSVFPPTRAPRNVVEMASGVEIRSARSRTPREHLRCQHAGVRVVARAVIAVEERERADVCRAPCANGAAASRCPSARSVDSCAMRPSATMARSFGIAGMRCAR